MCGRMLLTTPVSEIQKIFGVPEAPNLAPRWNIAPTQDIAAVRVGSEDGGRGGRHLVLLRWGLVPHWAEDPCIGNRMINARAESVADKPAFRTAFRQRRCLIPIDGFYEWQALEGGKRKQPYAIRRRDRAPMALAGLWERWPGPKGQSLPPQPLQTATIVTTTANAVLKPLHDRMPVVLAPSDWDLWLDERAPLPMVQDLLRPAPDDALEAYPVSTRVNNVRNDDESCIVPIDAQPTLF